jgi:hypothetical protein
MYMLNSWYTRYEGGKRSWTAGILICTTHDENYV